MVCVFNLSAPLPISSLPYYFHTTFMPTRNSITSGILSPQMLKFVAAWQGDAVAAARAAGYRNPVTDAYRLMNNPTVITEVKRKQRVIAEESGRRMAAQLTFDRSH